LAEAEEWEKTAKAKEEKAAAAAEEAAEDLEEAEGHQRVAAWGADHKMEKYKTAKEEYHDIIKSSTVTVAASLLILSAIA